MKIAFITLGCKVNTYETSAIELLFKEKGHTIVSAGEYYDACIINTCSVTNQASAKSRKMIRHAIKQNVNAVIGVMGCYSQMDSDGSSAISGVDYIIGNENKKQIVDLILSGVKRQSALVKMTDILQYKDFEDLEASEFNQTRAFLKIQDGCNNFCTYCIIPYTRGPIRSKCADLVIESVNKIVDKGYLEIVLTGIHTGKYADVNTSFTQLINRIIFETKIERLRISSIEINEITEEFLMMMKNNSRLAHHLHLPLQAGSNHVLKMMNRKYTCEEFKAHIDLIRAYIPDIAITTDVIVGFPEETEEDFQNTLNFVKECGFAKIHVFPFSLRKNTKAENLVQLPGQVIKERVSSLIEMDYELQLEYNKKFINKAVELIIESKHGEYMIGHSSNFLAVLVDYDEFFIEKKVTVVITGIKNRQIFGKII